MKPVLSLRNLSQVFFAGELGEVVALSDISLELMQNDFIVVVGPNGSGKSSLLKAIMEGQRTSGEIWLNDNDLNNVPIHERSRLISYMTQSPNEGVIGEFSLFENLLLSSFKAPQPAPNVDSVYAYVEQLQAGLRQRNHQPANSLSGGEKQILATLMAFQGRPSLLLCDEPTSSIDPKRALLIESLIRNYVEEKQIPVIWVTHDLDQALRLGNRIVTLNYGRIHSDLNSLEKAKLSRESILNLLHGG